MEGLQSFEDLINDLVSMVQYSKLFAIAVFVAFLFVFAGLFIINANIHDLKEQNRHLSEMIEALTSKGGKRDE